MDNYGMPYWDERLGRWVGFQPMSQMQDAYDAYTQAGTALPTVSEPSFLSKLGTFITGIPKAVVAPAGRAGKFLTEGLRYLPGATRSFLGEQLDEGGGLENAPDWMKTVLLGSREPTEQEREVLTKVFGADPTQPLWKFGEKYEPLLYSKKDWREISREPTRAMEESTKAAAGALSYMPIGAGLSVPQLAARSALTSGLGTYAVSQKQLEDPSLYRDLTTAALIGGAIGGGVGLAGKGLARWRAGRANLNQLDDALEKVRQNIYRAGGTEDDVARLLGSTGEFGSVNAKLNYLSGNPVIEEQLASVGFQATDKAKGQMAQQMLSDYGDVLGEAGRMNLQGTVEKVGGEVSGVAAETGFRQKLGEKISESAKNQIRGELRRELGTPAKKLGSLGLYDDAQKVVVDGKPLVQMGDSADDVIAKTQALLDDQGQIIAEATDDMAAKGVTVDVSGLRKQLTEKVNTSMTPQLRRPYIQALQTLDDVVEREAKTALGAVAPAGGALTAGTYTTDEVSNALVKAGANEQQITRAVDNVRSLTAGAAANTDDVLLGVRAAGLDQSAIDKFLGELGTATTGGAELSLRQISSVVRGNELIPSGKWVDVFNYLDEMGKPSYSMNDIAEAMGAAGLTEDAVNTALEGMLPQIQATEVAGKASEIPINDFYRLKQEIGKLGKWNQFSPPSEAQTAQAYNDLYMSMNDRLDDALKKQGFAQFRDVNKNLSVAQKLQNHAMGRIASTSGAKPLGFGELVGGGLGFAATGGSPVGAAGGAVLSRLQRSDVPQRLLIGAQQKLGEALTGQGGPGLLTRTLGGGLGQTLQNVLTSGVYPKVTSLIAGVSTGRGGQPTAAKTTAARTGVSGTQTAEIPGAVSPMSTRADYTGQIPYEQYLAEQGLSDMEAAKFGYSQDMTAADIATLGLPGTPQQTIQQKEVSMLDLFSAALQDTGDFGTAMDLTEFLAPVIAQSGFYVPGISEQLLAAETTEEADTTGKSMTPANAARIAMVNSGLQRLDEIENLYSSGTALQTKIGVPTWMMSESARQFDVASRNFSDILGRLRSGAQVTEEEEKRFRSLIPQFGDDPQTVASKLAALRSELYEILQRSSGYSEQNYLTNPSALGAEMEPYQTEGYLSNAYESY